MHTFLARSVLFVTLDVSECTMTSQIHSYFPMPASSTLLSGPQLPAEMESVYLRSLLIYEKVICMRELCDNYIAVAFAATVAMVITFAGAVSLVVFVVAVAVTAPSIVIALLSCLHAHFNCCCTFFLLLG